MNNLDRIAYELKELDKDLVEIDGVHLKPSQCYHYEADPFHILFNTNCPDSLKQKVEAILSRHIPQYENSSPPEA